MKVKESSFNDDRLKLINDIIVGIRTIKCYAWEHKYIQKVKEIRDKQAKYSLISHMIE
jgi:hypothetical protein